MRLDGFEGGQMEGLVAPGVEERVGRRCSQRDRGGRLSDSGMERHAATLGLWFLVKGESAGCDRVVKERYRAERQGPVADLHF